MSSGNASPASALELERAAIVTSSDALRRIVFVPYEQTFAEFPDHDRRHLLWLQGKIAELRYALLTGTRLADFRCAFDGTPPPWASVAYAMKQAGERALELDRRLTRISERRLSA